MEGELGGEHTRLNSAGSTVIGTRGSLGSLVEGRLLGVRGDLLLNLVTKSLAAVVC